MKKRKRKCKACDGDGESRDAHFAGMPCEVCKGSGLITHP